MEKITDKYYLGSNKNTFILYERKVSESGKESFKNLGYLSSLDAVYKELLEKEIRDNLEILNNIKQVSDMIEELKKFTINYVEHNENK